MHNFLLNFKNGLFTDIAYSVYVISTSTKFQKKKRKEKA